MRCGPGVRCDAGQERVAGRFGYYPRTRVAFARPGAGFASRRGIARAVRPPGLHPLRPAGASQPCVREAGVSAELLRIEPNCRACGAALTLLEMHFFDRGEGTAACGRCESEWMERVEAWRHGAPGECPEAP